MKKLLILLLSLILISCGGNTKKHMHRGDIVHISTECIGCYTEDDLEKVIDAANSRNSKVFISSLANTDYIMLPKGASVTVLKINVGKVNVDYHGKSVWVMYKHIKK